ncbi:hypothetical protein [Novosphingobium aquae]|uniref:HPr kinase/phosphorylase C-terminal domain-containing protein n=1 Tax=Novosphingobium aquae TaxID=3133435 RepID=A0ABU8SDW0_9SPHN
MDLPLAQPATPPFFQLQAASPNASRAYEGEPIQVAGDEWVQSRLYPSGEFECEWKNWLVLRADRDGRTIRYSFDHQADRQAFEAHIANFAASMSLLLQGEETLHSTVVWFNGRGIGLLGPSGAGKSTFAAHLISQGAELVTDDLLRITSTEKNFYAEPGPSRIKLFAHTADRHFAKSWPSGKWNPLSEKYLFPTVGHSGTPIRRPLDALLFLSFPEKSEPEEVSMSQMRGLEVFQKIAGSTMFPSFSVSERLSRQFAFAKHIAQILPVYKLTYPRRDDIFPDVLSLLERNIEFVCA